MDDLLQYNDEHIWKIYKNVIIFGGLYITSSNISANNTYVNNGAGSSSSYCYYVPIIYDIRKYPLLESIS